MSEKDLVMESEIKSVGPGQLKVCWGVKVEGGKRLGCGEEVSDPKIIGEVMKLINEFMRRVERRKDVLLSESNTPFDRAINELSSWLTLVETKVKEINDENIVKMRRAMINIGEKMLTLAKQAREKWLKTYRRELEKLIEKLRRNETTIIITGEPSNKNKSFTAHLYTKHLSIKITRVRGSSVTINISLVGSRGISVVTPRLFGDDVLKPMRYGLIMTDGSIDKRGYLVMNTNQLWQSVMWILTWPGRNGMRIHAVGLNEAGINVMWSLMAVDHRSEFVSKAKVAEEVSKLSDEEKFLTFLLTAILGDGNIDIINKTVRLVIGGSKHELWRGIIDRMRALGFRDIDQKVVKHYSINSSKAVELARKWLSNPMIKALVEDLALLPDAEKLRNIIALASAKVKPIGRSSVEVAGVRMSVHINNEGYVELRIRRKRLEDARAVLERLRNAGYNAELREYGGRFEVHISQDEIKRHLELVVKVCEVLRRMHEEAVGEGNTERAWATAKAMANLNCPTQDPRA
ncbi:hypothetical protein [Vulcanisaeta distributa]|uniref:Uncharacterized protein n=1 Tax=Vulcanisaeta distributa (strain DSM 14429 / JCM 11212 / NBRC 100878 / IC-017) TaxID=572478 RepID=E1QR43_VULDI|nr:hypothetical protein [Vulcanisaeta distributa]ADN51733.1 hypothetical protein Vdis_2365 [Vulcanisaeta distributa DSM 14429]